MARVADHDTTQIFAAADEWRDRCLVQGLSLLWPERQVWSGQNLKRFKACFIDRPDTSKDKGFEEKFQAQLSPEDDDVTRLACELLFVYFLFPTSVGASRKEELIRNVAGWKGIEIPEGAPQFRCFATGIGDPGLVFNTGRPNELTYLARFAIALSEKSAEERASLLAEHKRARELLDELAEDHREEFNRPPQLRHIILYLLFPDDYERIASEGHKARIAEAFSELLDKDEPDDVDDRLKAIRDKLQQYLPAQDLDFYWAPLRECWYAESESDTISPLQALAIKRQIVLYGPPGTGKTYQAREIASSLIRQRLLQLWGPKKFFAEPGMVDAIAQQRAQRVQFHPGYGYEDLVRGIQIGAGGQTEYRDGALLRLVAELQEEPEELRSVPFVLVLDEMNRADLSKVLGECFTLLEDRDASVRLGGHDEKARIVRLPSNLHFIGTMNLIDQSLEQVDFALRRRFLWFLRGFSREDFLAISQGRWESLVAAKKIKKSWESVELEFEELADRAQRLNADIDTNSYLGPQYQIGHTYFCDIVAFAHQFLIGSERRRNRVLFNRSGGALDPVAALWRYSLQPLLEQYLSGIDSAERDTLVRHARSLVLEGAVRE
jgi:5-methylcytosine-specific restriction protein B